MPAVLDPFAVTSLKVWHCKFKSLVGLKAFRNVERLVVAGYPDSSLEPLLGLSKLRHLELLHFPNAIDLSPLASLVKLEALSLACLPSWDSSGRKHKVLSLSPLSALPKLSSMELLGVVSLDQSLQALAENFSLKSARFSGYPAGAVEQFFQSVGAINAFLPREAG